LTALLDQLGGRLVTRKQMVVTAESCTGGGIARAMISLPGSGSWFERGFVTYSVEAKQDLLGVSTSTLDRYGVISEATAVEMVKGALDNSRGQVGVAVTGIAGPDAEEGKPVGTVCFAWSVENRIITSAATVFAGDRNAVCDQATLMAVRGLLDILRQAP
jgi:nicotinamide-nucleotide amidase